MIKNSNNKICKDTGKVATYSDFHIFHTDYTANLLVPVYFHKAG